MQNNKSREALLSGLNEIIRHAGTIILEHPDRTVTEKGAFDFVTEVDMAVNQYLMAALPELLPGSVVFSEESGSEDKRLLLPTWIVDPVDGTTNLIYDTQQSAVSVCLVENGRPLIGAVYNPYADELFTAAHGDGAFLNGFRLATRPDQTLAESLVGFGTSPYEKRLLLQDLPLLGAVFTRCIDLRRSGSAALDLCHVACGRLTVFFERILQPWDYAAGALILTESGGRITTFSGGALPFAAGASILASNGPVHEELLDLFQSIPGANTP